VSPKKWKKKSINNLPIVNGRSCDGCTKCCEGHLAADIRGQYMGKLDTGEIKPCIFVDAGKGCKEYEKRPIDPCRTFKCDWLTNPDIPESFKPSRSNSIFITRTINGVEYMRLLEAGRKLDSEVLSWAVSYALVNELNFAWLVLDNIFWIGSDDFNKMMDADYPMLQSET
jgi:hypothetical protein